MDYTVEATNYQLEVLSSKAKETLMLGGIGSGKSFIGAVWVVVQAIKHKDKKYRNKGLKIIIAANTYTQLMNASVEALIDLLDMMGIKYKAVLSGAKKRITFLNCTCYLYSLEKYNNIRGIEVDHIWVDEIAFCTKGNEAIKVLKGRMRNKVAENRQLIYTTSPNGFNFLYDKFEGKDDPTAEDYDKVRLIRAKTSENIYLPDGKYEELLEEYGGIDNPLAQQELLGQFVNLQEGAIYWGFDREENVMDCKLNRKYPVYVGLDFNVDNMSAVYIQYINGVFYCCKEVNLTHRNANTADIANQIQTDLEGYNKYIIPDSTGRNRSTKGTSESDHQMLRDHGLTVMETHNPFIRSRQTTVNSHFRNKKIFLSEDMKKTRKEIETLASRDEEGKVNHLSVALGYVAWKLAPIKRKAAAAESRIL